MANNSASGFTPLSQGEGIASYVLQHIGMGLKNNDPAVKITPTGFLKALIENTGDFGIEDHEKLRLTKADGHYQNVKLWYYQRQNASSVDESLDCVAGGVNDRATIDLAAPRIASKTFQVSDTDLMQYESEATATVKLGKAPTAFMEDFMKQILINCNAIAQLMNTRLASDVIFGVNQVNESAATTVVNINTDATRLNLTEGLQKVITDAQMNEFDDNIQLVGAGYLLNLQNLRKATSTNLAGINTSELDGYDYYRDYTAPSLWGGVNTFGVFAKNTIGLIDLNTLVGFRAKNLGVYQAFQISLPVYKYDGEVTMMDFDVRLRWNNCPTDIADAAYGGVRTIGEGWTIQISKNYGLFQTPATLYPGGDRLAGSNGALKYSFTNVVNEA